MSFCTSCHGSFFFFFFAPVTVKFNYLNAQNREHSKGVFFVFFKIVVNLMF